MKILFVCKSNVGRSQMVEAFFKKYSKKKLAVSTGTHAEKFKDLRLSKISKLVVKCMKDKGISLSHKIPTQLTPGLLDNVDKMFVMANDEDLPDYILNSSKVTRWEVEDTGGADYNFHVKIRNQIEELVKKLTNEIE